MEFPTKDEFAKEVAEKVLDEIIYGGKTIREWIEIIIKQQTCEDAISREDVINIIEDVCPIYSNDYRYILEDKIAQLPSVTPQPKIGHWIYEDVLHSRCSECGKYAIIANWSKVLSDFCPNCGAKMEEEE